MQFDHYILSGFASRLQAADVHSFDGLLYLLQEYEVGIWRLDECAVDLRNTEKPSGIVADLRFGFFGQERVSRDKSGRIFLVGIVRSEIEWFRSLLKELVELVIYEINLTDDDKKEKSVGCEGWIGGVGRSGCP